MEFAERWFGQLPRQLQSGLAFSTVFVGLLVQWFLLAPNFAYSLLIFLPIVLLTTHFGGTRTGYLVTAIASVSAIFLLLNLAAAGTSIDLNHYLQFILFGLSGIYLSVVESQRATLHRNTKAQALLSQPLISIPKQPAQLSYSLPELAHIKTGLEQATIILVTDPQGIIQYVSDRFCQISQYTPNEVIGHTHGMLNSGFHSREFFQDFWATITDRNIWQGEIQNRAKDGSLYWVDMTVVPICNTQGDIVQYQAVQFDITRRKQAELELQQLNDHLEDLVEERTARLQQSLGFEATLKRITDKVRDSLDESQILQTAVAELAAGLGASACHAAFYNLDEGTSKICYEFNPSIFSTLGQVSFMSEAPEIYQVLLQGEYVQFCNLERHPIRGRVTMLACPMFDDQDVVGDLWLIIDKEYAFRELEIRLVQQVASQCAIALRQAQLYENAQAQVKILEQVNRLKDDFLSTVSHELRTPVSNMKMSIHLLELVLKRQQAENIGLQKADQYLQILKYECEREISLINDLLDLQRLESGQRSLALETVQVQSWLVQILQSFENRIRDRQLTLRLEIPPHELPPLVADLPSLERILSELLNNACKYTPPGEAIVLAATSKPGKMQFSICNFGVEIPAAELPRIFDKFYRVPNADPWKQGGTGLGLALVQRLVQHLEGTIQVQSQSNHTEFIIEVPNQLVREVAEGLR